jgi:hypothetical protein
MRVGFDPAAADDSWRRVESFFAEHLKGHSARPGTSPAEAAP